MNDRNDMDNNLVDLDFSSNSEMHRIRENERIEYEKRRRRAAQLRRAEMIRRKKAERIRKMILAWGVLVFALVVIVALIIGIVSLFTGDKDAKDDTAGKTVAQEETELVSELTSFDGIVFGKDNTDEQYVPSVLNSMYSTAVESSLEPLASPVSGSHLAMITDTYLWNSSDDVRAKIKQIVRDYPLYSNGYVWSVENSMKHPKVSSYLYDTNAAFISAVCDICLWEGNTSFLDSVDMTGEANSDISLGLTVGEKLEKVVSHFFDYEDFLNGGGIRYNTEDGLVYVLTADNNGTDAGKPSNLFYNYRFGYIDTYNNLSFNAAMNDLSCLYTLANDKEKADKYLEVAKTNKKAINKKLYDKKLGRYVGWIDKDGNVHDAGFTVINLMATSLGVADEEKRESILSWVEGKREITSDGLPTPNRYASLLAPAFSTLTLDDLWFNAEGNYSLDDEAGFGDYWMNGAACSLAGNYYLLSVKDTADFVNSVAKLYKENRSYFDLPASDKAEPFLHYSLTSSNAVKKMFGISTDGKNLCINPLFNDGENVGINNIAFSGNFYDVLFHKDTVYVTSDENAAVRLKIGGFKKNEILVLTTVENGVELSVETVSADKTGTLSISKKVGGNIYLRIEKDNTKE